jgi:hypothetical protein
MKLLAAAALCGGFLMLPGAMPAADKKPAAPALPKEAVAISPGTYTYTDAQGKKWIFRQTPFGLAKFEDRERPATDPESDQKRIAQTKAFDDGEFVRFERPGPFGVYHWKQKKTDLNAVEKAAWDRDRGAQPDGKE